MNNSIKTVLDSVNIILFDLDGVITSEESYWSCAAITVAKYLGFEYKGKLYGDDIKKFRNMIFDNDSIIKYLKNKGCNTNWDLGNIVYNVFKMLGLNTVEAESFKKVNQHLQQLNLVDMFDYYKYIESKTGFGRESDEWIEMQQFFNRIFYDDLINYQVSVLDLEIIHSTLSKLSQIKTLGVGTGRLIKDVNAAFESFDIYKYFDSNRIVTYSDIQYAQERHNVLSLSKPNPYVFARGAIGLNADDSKIVLGIYDENIMSKVLVVGDAGSDILAGQKAGAKTCAVLTGIDGLDGKEYFESIHTDLIIDDISHLV